MTTTTAATDQPQAELELQTTNPLGIVEVTVEEFARIDSCSDLQYISSPGISNFTTLCNSLSKHLGIEASRILTKDKLSTILGVCRAVHVSTPAAAECQYGAKTSLWMVSPNEYDARTVARNSVIPLMYAFLSDVHGYYSIPSSILPISTATTDDGVALIHIPGVGKFRFIISIGNSASEIEDGIAIRYNGGLEKACRYIMQNYNVVKAFDGTTLFKYFPAMGTPLSVELGYIGKMASTFFGCGYTVCDERELNPSQIADMFNAPNSILSLEVLQIKTNDSGKYYSGPAAMLLVPAYRAMIQYALENNVKCMLTREEFHRNLGITNFEVRHRIDSCVAVGDACSKIVNRMFNEDLYSLLEVSEEELRKCYVDMYSEFGVKKYTETILSNTPKALAKHLQPFVLYRKNRAKHG
jgi:hypothetical protein